MKTVQVGTEVLYALADPVVVRRSDIELLKKRASMTDRRRMRICTHKDTSDSLHEMLIVHPRGAYVRPHRHSGKIEAFHVVEGAVDMVVFDDDGAIMGVTQMGEFSTGKPFYHRIDRPYFHTLIITSDHLVFHEVTNGPFDRSDTEFPSWAPAEEDMEAVRAYQERLARAVAECSERDGTGTAARDPETGD